MFIKIKSFWENESIFVPFLIIMVAVASFGLGRLSTLNNNENYNTSRGVVQVAGPVVVSKTQSASTTTASVKPDKGSLLASKTGTKYHLPSCPGAAQIKEENRIYFSSVAEAKAAGYTPAANCPGLEVLY